jgi:hypothetical protein
MHFHFSGIKELCENGILYLTYRLFTSKLKAARLQIHPNFHESFENVFKGKILLNEQRKYLTHYNRHLKST